MYGLWPEALVSTGKWKGRRMNEHVYVGGGGVGGGGDAVRKADPGSDARSALPPSAGTLLAGENAESALANEAWGNHRGQS